MWTPSSEADDSGILVAVPSRTLRLLVVLVFACAQPFGAQTQPPQGAAPSAQPTQTTAPENPQPAPAPVPAPPAPQAAPLTKTLSLVVLDPAHGGADPGARGASGITESDVALGFARLLRISLEAQGLRVMLTRQANEGPSFDDRSKLVNAQRGAIYISIHVASTGQPGTVRAYSFPQSAWPPLGSSPPRSGMLLWDRAQFNFTGQSRKLAELIQIQMAQRFRSSSETPFEAPVRQLRTVGAPAVAVEVSSVSLPDRGLLDQMGLGLADGVARAVAAFRTVYDSGAK